MVSFDFALQLKIRNAGYIVNRSGIRADIQRKVDNSDEFISLSQTETVYHETDFTFKHRCTISYRFGLDSRYKIIVYGIYEDEAPSRILGEVIFSLASVIAAAGTQSFLLFPTCSLDVHVSLPETYSQAIRLQFFGRNLYTHYNRTTSTYITILLATPEKNILLHRTPIKKEEKNPTWSEFVLPLHILQHYSSSPIQVYCFNYNANSSSDSLIGYFSTTLAQLQLGAGTMNSYMLTDGNGSRLSEKTNISLIKIELTLIPSFLQLFEKSIHLSLSVAVDLTASNGKSDDASSLHYIHPYHASSYERAILGLLPQLTPLQSQPKIVALGFGAKIEPAYQLSHCFNLSGRSDNAFVNGINELVEAYRYARIVVKPFAPTEFSEIIYYVSKFAKAEARKPHGLFFILVLLTDGAPAQPQRTINAIVDASPYPMTIIAIGIGENRDFSGLKSLESPFLKNLTTGDTVTRQNFFFVEAAKLNSNETIPIIPIMMSTWAATRL